MQALRHETAGAPGRAAITIASQGIGSPAIRAELERLLRGPSERVAVRAALALATWTEPTAPIASRCTRVLAASDPDPGDWPAPAWYALPPATRRRVTSFLRRLAEDSQSPLQRDAAQALARVRAAGLSDE